MIQLVDLVSTVNLGSAAPLARTQEPADRNLFYSRSVQLLAAAGRSGNESLHKFNSVENLLKLNVGSS